MERAKLYEYAVILYPTEDEAKAGKVGEIIVPKNSVLALTQQAAVVAASRAIPEKYLDKLDRVEVAVRPF